MPFSIAEWFGYDLNDTSATAEEARAGETCPFISVPCTKTFNDGTRSGACSVHTTGEFSDPPVIICPNRLYAGHLSILDHVAQRAFGPGHTVVGPTDFGRLQHDGFQVLALGKSYGGEVRLPSRGGRGGYFVDWILARISPSGDLAEFAAVEVQTIDTTGTYRPEVQRLRTGSRAVGRSRAGLNWENVNKRILPQLIYKGHVLRRENLCRRGLFFISPSAVHERIMTRLGNTLLPYTNLQPGSITFLHFNVAPYVSGTRGIKLEGEFSSTIDQVALAFTSPTNLPESGVYEQAIRAAIRAISS